MYKKYLQKIWLASEIKITFGNSVSYKYKLEKKLAEITGKKNAINWIEKFYLSYLSQEIKREKYKRLVLELFDIPRNYYFLIIPWNNNPKHLKLRYVSVSELVINISFNKNNFKRP